MFKYAIIADAGADGHGFAEGRSGIPTLFSTLDELLRLLNGDWIVTGVFVDRSVPVPVSKVGQMHLLHLCM